MSRILVVEDEAGIASFVVKGLTAAGHTATVATDGPAGLAAARADAFDLIVLDLGLPGVDGMSVLETIRSERIATPVVILTAREGIDHLVAGLGAGADDFIAKPFRFDELLARINARLRTGPTPIDHALRHGDVVLDPLTRRVQCRGADVELSAREFLLAETFLRHPDQVLSRQQLLSRVWGYDFDSGSNVVDVYVGYLRRKLGAEFVSTVRGVGYRLGAPSGT
jgi:two-component system copper resistance phosphate regulon response regulator CusR